MDYFAICINTSGSAALCCDCCDSMLASHWPRPSHWFIRLNSSQNSLEIICENPPLTNKSSDQDITPPLSSHRRGPGLTRSIHHLFWFIRTWVEHFSDLQVVWVGLKVLADTRAQGWPINPWINQIRNMYPGRSQTSQTRLTLVSYWSHIGLMFPSQKMRGEGLRSTHRAQGLAPDAARIHNVKSFTFTLMNRW